MPVQTRAGGQPQPASKVYKPKVPEPKQQHFPGRRRQIKTYGRRSAPKRVDQTLTQMNFVSSGVPEELDLLNSSDDEEKEEVEEPPVVAGKAAKKRPSQKSSRENRRRTMGDVEDENEHEKPRHKKRRKTLGDPPSASSSFHTQTLTQFFSTSSKDEEDWKTPEADGEEDDQAGLVRETPKKMKGASRGVSVTLSAKTKSVTPSNRMTKMEIPSSTSPATPLLLRYSPAKEASPLKNKSSNISVKQSTRKSAAKLARDFVVQDSYSTNHSSPVTPRPKANSNFATQQTVTPAKKLRFDLPEDKENITPGRTKPKSPKPPVSRSTQRQPLSEVPDSDDEAETENEDEGTDISEVTTLQQAVQTRYDLDNIIIHTEEENVEGNDPHYEAGAETQALHISSGNHSSLVLESKDPPEAPDGEFGVQENPQPPRNRETIRSTPVAESTDDEIVEQTPTRARPRNESKHDAVSEDTQEYTESFTQGMESQRVPLETIKATGPITDKSDIIISIYGEHVQRMAQRIKTHEFRSWKFPESVHRVWIYITKPQSQLKYMCIFGAPKAPGEINEEGFGNAEFNMGMKRSTIAHEVLSMYELNNPVSYEVMKQYGWPTAPQKFAYVPPAVVGQLTSNLRCALWDDEDERSSIRSSLDMTESQELADQIRSDIDHATQHESFDRIEVIFSSQSPPRTRSTGNRSTPRQMNVFARPRLPSTMSASSARSLPPTYSQRSRGGVRPSQASTISQVSSSSPVVSPEKSMPLPSTADAQRGPAPVQLPGTSSPSAHRHSLRSSQFPTKSQMLPDSLLHVEIQEPPPIIWDSADEDSE